MNFNTELNLAKQVAQKAGKLLRETIISEVQILSTDNKDIKLQTDQDSEKLILQKLTQHSPHPVLGEEFGSSQEIDFSQPYWIVDPLDGSMNFIKGIPLYCVSIALWQNNKPILGVIYFPYSNELLEGSDNGCFMNGTKIKLNNKPLACKDAIIATGFPTYRDYSPEALSGFVNKINQFKKVRMFGSAALSLAWLALERVDFYEEDSIMLWDVAAGLAIVKAAGGEVKYKQTSSDSWALNVQAAACKDLLL